MAKLSKRDKNNIEHLFRGLLVISSVSICFYLDLGIYYFIGAIFLSVFASAVFGRFLDSIGMKKTSNKGVKTTVENKIKQQQTKKVYSDGELLTTEIDNMSGTDFERLMEMYYQDKGYKVQRIGGSGDYEVDLILQDKKGFKIAVQCKRWKKDVGNNTVLRLNSGKRVHGCYDAWIVTTSHFTRSAKEAAESLNIKLINGAQVHDMIGRWRKERVSVSRSH